MSRIVTSSLGPAAWRAGLADPHRHWKRGRSAWELAVSWEARQGYPSGLPEEVETVLGSHPAFPRPALLVGIIEHRVALDTPTTPSHNDLWCMLDTDAGQVSMAVEAKAGEEFSERLGKWLKGGKESRVARLHFLCETLGAQGEPDSHLRYQLFHRTASAVLEARRWRADKAVLLVQSFAESRSSWQDFTDFGAFLGLEVRRNGMVGRTDANGIQLYLGWVDSPTATDQVAALAV